METAPGTCALSYSLMPIATAEALSEGAERLIVQRALIDRALAAVAKRSNGTLQRVQPRSPQRATNTPEPSSKKLSAFGSHMSRPRTESFDGELRVCRPLDKAPCQVVRLRRKSSKSRLNSPGASSGAR